MSQDDEHHERYADRKKKSQRADLESLKQNLFKGDQDRVENIMKEYRFIQKEKKTDIAIDEAANHPINEHKNRYPDVLPFKNTAVKLQPLEGVAGSEYINANFVTDLGAPPDRPSQKYICCQAPLVHTFNDFWRMVWEQHTPLVVMITNLVEGNKIKADTYWPTRVDQTLRYGPISVKLTREYHRGHSVVIRTFHVWKNSPQNPAPGATPSNNFNFGFTANSGSDADDSPREISGSDFDEAESKGWGSGHNSGYNSGEDHFSFSSSSESDLEPIDGQEVRKITQLHCTKWPDFGVPESAQVMKDLVYELELRKRRLEDPVVVHCSAGIGRTGTFVAIHQALQKDLHGELISIRDIVRSLRNQRIGMVQSKEQYVFLYGVVSEMLRDRDSLLNLRSKKHKRLSYIPSSRSDRNNDSVARPSRNLHLLSTSPRLTESVNQHLILSQSSPFASLDLGRKGAFFHEKIIDHSLSSSTASISSSLKSQSPAQPQPSSSSTPQQRPILRSRESSPQLKVPSPPAPLAKSSEVKPLEPSKDDKATRTTRPRGRSLPFMYHRSTSDDAISTPPLSQEVFISSGDSHRTLAPSAHIFAAPATLGTHTTGSLPSSYAPPLSTLHNLDSSTSSRSYTTSSSLTASGRHTILDEDLSQSSKSQNRSKLRMASDAVTITATGNSSPDVRSSSPEVRK